MDEKTTNQLRKLHKQYWDIANSAKNGIKISFTFLGVAGTATLYVYGSQVETGELKLSRPKNLSKFEKDCLEQISEMLAENDYDIPEVAKKYTELDKKLERISNDMDEIFDGAMDYVVDCKNFDDFWDEIQKRLDIQAIQNRESKASRRAQYLKLKKEFEG